LVTPGRFSMERSRESHRSTVTLPLGGLVAIGLLAYLNSFRGKFVFDDIDALVDNPFVQAPWRFWFHSSGKSLTPQMASLAVRPVVALSFAANHRLGGVLTWGYHAVNVVIHVLAAMVLFGLVRRTLEIERFRDRFARSSRWLAFAVALLWEVHPLQTESVTYIVQRSESLMGLFYLLTFYCALRAHSSTRPARWRAGAVVACALGMGSKEVMATAPVLIVLFERAFLFESFGLAFRRQWKFYSQLAATWAILLAFSPLRVTNASAGFGLKELSPREYAQSQFGVITHYLRISFWPSGLCLDYLWPVARRTGEILPAATFVGILLVATFWAARRWPAIGFLGLWFFLILAPTSTIVPIADLAFDHRMYLSLAALVAIVVIGTYVGAERLSARIPRLSGPISWTVGAVFVAVVASLGLLTHQRNFVFADVERFWRDNVNKAPENQRAVTNLGTILWRQGRFDESRKLLERALEIAPRYPLALNNLGYSLYREGKLGESKGFFMRAIRADPDYASPRLNLGNLLADEGDLDGALQNFREAVRLDSGSAVAQEHLGGALIQKGQIDDAIACLSKSLALKPNSASALTRLGIALSLRGNFDGASSSLAKALEIAPGFAEAHFYFGSALDQRGKTDEAAREFRKALQNKPDYALAKLSLATLLAREGKMDEAVRYFEDAQRIGDTDAESHLGLGTVLDAQGRWAEAVALYRFRLRMRPEDVETLNDLAWLLATCPAETVRKPAEALELAERACRLSAGKVPEPLETLAAAWAAAGDFKRASSEIRRAIEVASGLGRTDLLVEYRLRSELYEKGQAFRQEAHR